jgi:uncharacterized protein YidB (DUF937 family)
MSMLDDLAGKVKTALGNNPAASGMVDHLLTYVQNAQASGGLQGLLQKFEAGGMGNLVQSWISTGKNLPVSPDQVKAALGSGEIAAIASKLGITPEQASQQVSQVLPHVVDQLTPTGQLPSMGGLMGQLGGLFKKLTG